MKRYQLAKREGTNWQVILVQDCETDIKILTLECVRKGVNWGETNKKVMKLINETINELESERVKSITKTTLTNFASRVYLQWLSIYGNRKLGLMVLGVLAQKGISVPSELKTKLNTLPKNISDYVYNRAVPNSIYNVDYERELQARINKVFEMQAKEDYSYKYSLRASIEREIRAEWHEKQLQSLVDKGIDLVWIDTHANCSERCQDWQGKLYSISGKTGKIDGISYRPLSDATDRYETTKAGKTYKNGTLSGFNCRHTIKPYKTGSKPNYIPSEVIDRQREIERKQREMERNIRKYEAKTLGWKKNKVLATSKEEKAQAQATYIHYKNLVNKWENEYISFCRKNNVPFYPSRLKV